MALQLSQTDERLGRLYEALETGKLDLDDLAPRIKGLREKRELLLRAKAEVSRLMPTGGSEVVSLDAVAGYVSDLSRVLEDGSISERRSFLRSFVKTVDREDSRVTIHYTLPVPPEHLSDDPARVLDIVAGGGAAGTRTPYLFNAIEALSQMSYSPTCTRWPCGPAHRKL